MIALGSLAQTKEEALIADNLVEYGPVTIAYRNEAEALTFAPASSTWVKELTWRKAVQQVKNVNESPEQGTAFSTTLETPSQWLGKEQFLVIYSPKTSFTVEVNGYKTKLASPGVNTKVRLTPLLERKGTAITISIISEKAASDIDDLAYKILLMATSDVLVAFTHVRTVMKYPNYYRSLNWTYHFKMKNYSKSPRYTSFFRVEEKVRDAKGKEVHQFVSDSTDQRSLHKPSKSHWHFYFYNHPEVYSYKWSAETPHLLTATSGIFSSRYDASEVTSERVGIRTSEIKSDQLKINNLPVWLKPVAYVHPPFEASVPTTEELRDNIIKLKQHHINTLLVYGLPANNNLYDLADAYGLYIIQHLYANQEQNSGDSISDNLWLRQRLSMIYQIRNRPSVVAWAADTSTNMSKNLTSALRDSLRVLDPDRPYLESAVSNLPSSAPQLEKLSKERLLKLKKKYQPVSMKISKDSSITILNLHDFYVLDNVLLRWKILDGERVLQEGEEKEVNIKPGNSQLIKLPFSFKSFKDKAYSLSFEIILKEELMWADKGFVLAWEELKASDVPLSFR